MAHLPAAPHLHPLSRLLVLPLALLPPLLLLLSSLLILPLSTLLLPRLPLLLPNLLLLLSLLPLALLPAVPPLLALRRPPQPQPLLLYCSLPPPRAPHCPLAQTPAAAAAAGAPVAGSCALVRGRLRAGQGQRQSGRQCAALIDN